MRSFKSFLRDTSGATAIEYGLIATMISVAIVGVLQVMGGRLWQTFTTIGNAIHG